MGDNPLSKARRIISTFRQPLHTVWTQIRTDRMLVAYSLDSKIGPTEPRSWSGSKLFDTLIEFLKDVFEKVDFEVADDNQRMQHYPSCKELRVATQTISRWLQPVYQYVINHCLNVAWRVTFLENHMASLDLSMIGKLFRYQGPKFQCLLKVKEDLS